VSSGDSASVRHAMAYRSESSIAWLSQTLRLPSREYQINYQIKTARIR